jgi:predicted esterase
MKNRNPISLVAVTAATLLATAWLCQAGEVSYLETFDAYPYPWVATNVHATYPDWLNGDLSTAPSNGVLRAWSDFPSYNPTNTFANLKSLVLVEGGKIEADRDLEVRADLLRLSGDGKLCLSLFGANTNLARLEMDVDNFGTRQTRDVTEDDFLTLVYTNAQRQKLPYRLFVPADQQPGTLYPLVLCLHSSGSIGNDNVSQLREQPRVFASPSTQAKHPCFVVAPQVSSAVTQQDPTFAWWQVRERVVGIVTNLMARYPIDPDRLYVTGISLGGIGTWSFADTYPDVFAAAVPMAGLLPSEYNGLPSEYVNAITHLPVWAFHGAKDLTIPVDAVYIDPAFPGWATKASRGTVADLRRCGGFPIYTEYAWAGHGIVPYEKMPGLVDWLMAQRRGTPGQGSPWIAVTAPVSNGVWTTSYTNLDLAGTACADAAITNVVWRNENMAGYPSGPATGTTNWVATGIPLRSGRIYGTRVFAFTNLVTVTVTGTSWSELYGGATTFNTVLRVVHVPIRLRATMDGGQTRLDWSGAAPSYVLQSCTDLGLADWVDVTSIGATNITLPHSGNHEFYRVKLP